MKVLLFASGIGDRWKAPCLKQLVPIQGEPLIVRTIRQLENRGVAHVVITHEPDIKEAVEGLSEVYYSPPSTMWPNTFLDSESLWKGRILPFHADVVWDPKALDTVLDSTGLCFFGTRKGPWENFAIAFDPVHYERMKVAAQKALDVCVPIGHRCGTWETYRALVGIPITAIRKFESRVWHEVKQSQWSDYTYDFDLLKRWHEWLRANPWAKEEA